MIMTAMSAVRGASAHVEYEFACHRHRQFFVDVLRAHHLTTSAQQTRIGRKFVAVVAGTHTEAYATHLRERTCMGCAFEQSGPRCWAWAEQALRALIVSQQARRLAAHMFQDDVCRRLELVAEEYEEQARGGCGRC